MCLVQRDGGKLIAGDSMLVSDRKAGKCRAIRSGRSCDWSESAFLGPGPVQLWVVDSIDSFTEPGMRAVSRWLGAPMPVRRERSILAGVIPIQGSAADPRLPGAATRQEGHGRGREQTRPPARPDGPTGSGIGERAFPHDSLMAEGDRFSFAALNVGQKRTFRVTKQVCPEWHLLRAN
ncbi:hypothetical protein FQZ97_780770 [compost metagenome]